MSGLDSTDVFKKLDDLSKNDMTILDRISDIRVSQARTEAKVQQNTVDLSANALDMAKHIRRTDLLESYLDRQKGFLIALSVLSPLAAGLLTFITNYILNN